MAIMEDEECNKIWKICDIFYDGQDDLTNHNTVCDVKIPMDCSTYQLGGNSTILTTVQTQIVLHESVLGIFKEKLGEVNTDGTSKGNPGKSNSAFCVRDESENLIHAEAQQIGKTSNLMVEAKAVRMTLQYCLRSDIMEEILDMKQHTHMEIHHIYKEANCLADALAKRAYSEREK
ncbi:hypothetical protein HAX54_033535 [Datura stramonium]|uniref:RNase H type-1 domain-containing protein n=1 Tax=Datura stramonium TaxID=4076 RepID=A0ABS8RLP4_DATST|nr:hypothetical protein [Datura stramonium]